MNLLIKLTMLPTAIRIKWSKIRLYYPMWYWQFCHSILKWVQDEEGDIGLRILWIVTLIKYKESTIVEWFKDYPQAPKRVRDINVQY